MGPAALVLTVLAACVLPSHAFTADAGVRVSLTRNKTVDVTSNSARAFAVVDGVQSTHWQSEGCFPGGYWSRPDLNAVYGLCNAVPGSCTYVSVDNTTNFVDGNTNTPSAFGYFKGNATANATAAFLQIKLRSTMTVQRIGYKLALGANATISLIFANKTSTIVTTVQPSDTYLQLNVVGPWPSVTAIRVQSTVSNSTLQLFELAVLNTSCTQYATVDLGAVMEVGTIRTRHWAGGYAVSSSLLTSVDGKTFTARKALDPLCLATVDHWFTTPLKIRYIRVLHVTTNGDYNKVYVWTIDAFDRYGPWGPAPASAVQKNTFRQMLGVNGIWGWGMKDQSYASNFSAVATIARNYHNMNWDVKLPLGDPKYDTMATTGTGGQWWLDWDVVYREWKKRGLTVIASFQFTSDTQIPISSQWGTSPYNTSYTLGYKFARHFGPTKGTGMVWAFEVGNEPWGYAFDFYSQVLLGFLDGLKAGDPALLRLPCAMQADDPYWDQWKYANYIGSMVSQEAAGKLNALNIHAYSYFTADNGSTLSVHPEHPGSTMHSVNNMVRWRNANAPSLPVWLTEWGWDAARDWLGEKCAMTECVSSHEQGIYAVRGLLMVARKQIAQAIWFFYGNSDTCDTRFCRSGLRDMITSPDGIPLKPLAPYKALVGFLGVVGGARFESIVREDATAYVYALRGASGVTSHLVAWRPIVGTDSTPITINVTHPSIVTAPTFAYTVNGTGAAPTTLPTYLAASASYTITITSTPTIIGVIPPEPSPSPPPVPSPIPSPSPVRSPSPSPVRSPSPGSPCPICKVTTCTCAAPVCPPTTG